MVTTAQLYAAGVDRNGIAHRVRHGRLVRRHRGVYQVGPIEAPLGKEMAALLACGDQAALSHDSAAAIWGFRPPHEGDVHITVQRGRATSRPGIRVHRTLSLNAAVHQGLRLTTPARTLADIGTTLTDQELDRAVEQALVLRLTTHEELAGTTRLKRALQTEPSLTRSEAERRLLTLIRAARLPQPATNVRVGRHEADLLWRAHRLVVEVDGYAFHGSCHAFERDRRRDADLVAAGYRVLRFTWRQITKEPEAVVARLATMTA